MEAGNSGAEVSADEKEIKADDNVQSDADENAETDEEIKEEKLHLQTKTMPAFITLSAGAIAAIYTRLQNYKIVDALICILVTLLIFWFIGDIVKHLLDTIEINPPKEENPDGEDIEMENVDTQQIEE